MMDLRTFLADALRGVELRPGAGIDGGPHIADAELACGEVLAVRRDGWRFWRADVGAPFSTFGTGGGSPADALWGAITRRLMTGVDAATAAALAVILRNLDESHGAGRAPARSSPREHG
jgi:hypothetical protein